MRVIPRNAKSENDVTTPISKLRPNINRQLTDSIFTNFGKYIAIRGVAIRTTIVASRPELIEAIATRRNCVTQCTTDNQPGIL